MNRGVLLGAAIALVLQIGEVARAHDMEHLAQAALHPGDPDVMVLRFVQGGDGLFYTEDGGASWQLLCKSAIYPETTQIYDTFIAGDGHVLLATGAGVYEDDGHGCNFGTVAALEDRWVLDLERHPGDPSTTFAVVSDAARSAFGLMRRDGDGQWSEVGEYDDRVVQRVHAVQTADGVRLYTSAFVGTVSVDGIDMLDFVVRVSDDEGATWREHAYGPVQGAFALEGVDPTDPDRLIAVIHRPEITGHTLDEDLDQVLVSTDQGETFTHYLVLTETTAVTFAPDGRVWLGDIGSTAHQKAIPGLWFAPDLATPPAQLTEYPVACLAHQPATDTLFACQRWWFGTVEGEQGTFSASLRFQEVDAMVQCAGVDLTASCEQQLCRSYCRVEHFADAPACRAYDEATCTGSTVVQPPGAGGTGTAIPTADAGPTSGSAGASGRAGAGASPRPDAGADASADAAAHDAPARADEGCACTALGSSRGASPASAALAACALVMLARRMRSRRARRTLSARYFSSNGSPSMR